MTVFIRSRLFLIACLLPALRFQLADWLRRTRWELRFAVGAIAGWLAAAYAGFLAQLPSGWFDALGAQLLTAPGALVALMLLTIATISVALGVLSAKALRSL